MTKSEIFVLVTREERHRFLLKMELLGYKEKMSKRGRRRIRRHVHADVYLIEEITDEDMFYIQLTYTCETPTDMSYV